MNPRSPSGKDSSTKLSLKRKERSSAAYLSRNEDENGEDDESQIKRVKYTSAVSVSVGDKRSAQKIIKEVKKTEKSYSNSTTSSRAKSRPATKSSKEAKSIKPTSGPASKTPAHPLTAPATSSGKTDGDSSFRAGLNNEDAAARPDLVASVISAV